MQTRAKRLACELLWFGRLANPPAEAWRDAGGREIPRRTCTVIEEQLAPRPTTIGLAVSGELLQLGFEHFSVG